MVTNSPSAILRPICERSRSGGTSTGWALGGASGFRAVVPAGYRSQERLHDVDVVGRGTTAPADQAHPNIHKPSGVLGHVLRRAEIDVATFHRARHAGVRLSRQRCGGDGTHPLERVQHGHRTDAAVASHHIGAPRFNLRTIVLGGRSIQAIAVFVDGDLRHDWAAWDSPLEPPEWPDAALPGSRTFPG